MNHGGVLSDDIISGWASRTDTVSYTHLDVYKRQPLLLNIEMKDFIHDGSEVNRPNNALDIYLKELGSESPGDAFARINTQRY